MSAEVVLSSTVLAPTCGLSEPRLSDRHDRGRRAPTYARPMMSTYAVKWREPDGGTCIGSLAFGRRTLRLEGRRPGGDVIDRQIGYEELRGLRIGRQGSERLDGRPALVVERADGQYLVTSAGTGVGVLYELIERLAELQLTAP